MAAAAVDPIQDILDNHGDMADFLEIEAQVDDPEQRARIITSGFWDLQELQNKSPEFAEKVCKVLRHQRGNRTASAVSVFTESVLCVEVPVPPGHWPPRPQQLGHRSWPRHD